MTLLKLALPVIRVQPCVCQERHLNLKPAYDQIFVVLLMQSSERVMGAPG